MLLKPFQQRDQMMHARVGFFRALLQQLEIPGAPDVTVNDALRPVSRFFSRLTRSEQLLAAAPEAMRVLTDQAETGAVTLALPQDVQVEAFDYPVGFFEPRVWRIPRVAPDPAVLAEAAAQIRDARSPVIVAGGGVIYSEATEALRRLVDATGIPVAETMAGKGALPFDHPSAVGAVGVTGTAAANLLAREADLVIGIGTRWTDFSTASKTAFQHPGVRFLNVNVARFDAHKLGGLPIVADARAALESLADALQGWAVETGYRSRATELARDWDLRSRFEPIPHVSSHGALHREHMHVRRTPRFDDEQVAIADAMHEEYKAIVDAGLIWPWCSPRSAAGTSGWATRRGCCSGPCSESR